MVKSRGRIRPFPFHTIFRMIYIQCSDFHRQKVFRCPIVSESVTTNRLFTVSCCFSQNIAVVRSPGLCTNKLMEFAPKLTAFSFNFYSNSRTLRFRAYNFQNFSERGTSNPPPRRQNAPFPIARAGQKAQCRHPPMAMTTPVIKNKYKK